MRLLIPLVLFGLSGPLQALIRGQPDVQGRFGSVVSIRTDPGRRCTATRLGFGASSPPPIVSSTFRPAPRAGAFQPGGQVLVSNWPEPGGAAAYQTLTVKETQLPASFAAALGRLHGFQERRIADYRGRYSGEDLDRRIRPVHADSHIMARFPDLAVVAVDGESPSTPVAPVDLKPLAPGADAVLEDYGCERVADLAAGRRGVGPISAVIPSVRWTLFASPRRFSLDPPPQP